MTSDHTGSMPGHRPDSLWSPSRRPLTVGLVLTITLVASEALAVATAMPVVARDIGGLSLYGWVFSAFFLGSLIGISVVGGLIDERGIVVPFVGGLVLFGVGLFICGLAPSMETIVVGRFIQGLGGGAVPPVAYVAIGRSLPDRLRPHMFAIMSAAWVLPGVAGPAIAGLIDERGMVLPFVGGLVLFGVGLLISGLASSMETIVVGRFIQGLGGGA
ncbi:MAG TPA: MFS transporter, partial [Candidatus Limnocylindrales bacterium]|nr:MFS transporter [Candidatus Limnocylindrales bacterium]